MPLTHAASSSRMSEEQAAVSFDAGVYQSDKKGKASSRTAKTAKQVEAMKHMKDSRKTPGPGETAYNPELLESRAKNNKHPDMGKHVAHELPWDGHKRYNGDIQLADDLANQDFYDTKDPKYNESTKKMSGAFKAGDTRFKDEKKENARSGKPMGPGDYSADQDKTTKFDKKEPVAWGKQNDQRFKDGKQTIKDKDGKPMVTPGPGSTNDPTSIEYKASKNKHGSIGKSVGKELPWNVGDKATADAKDFYDVKDPRDTTTKTSGAWAKSTSDRFS